MNANIVIVSQIFVNNQVCTIKTLNGNNFFTWKSDVELALGVANLDMALLEEQPANLTA